MVVPLICPCRDEIITLWRCLIDREFAPHASVLREQIGQGYPPNLFRNRICQQLVEPAFCPRPRYFAFGKGAHVLNADMLGHMQAFIAYMFEIVGTAERPFFTNRFVRHDGMIVI